MIEVTAWNFDLPPTVLSHVPKAGTWDSKGLVLTCFDWIGIERIAAKTAVLSPAFNPSDEIVSRGSEYRKRESCCFRCRMSR